MRHALTDTDRTDSIDNSKETNRLTRRRYLAFAGTATALSLAGCTGADDDDDDTDATADADTGSSDEDEDEDEAEPEDEGGADDDAQYIDETDEPIELSFGETAAVSFDIEYTVHDLELMDQYEREGGDRVSDASDGQQFAAIEVEVTNNYESNVRIPLPTDFSILDGEGSQFDRDVYGHADEYDGGEVQSGITREGILMFEIPDDLDRDDLIVTLVRDGRTPGGTAYQMDVRWSA